MEKKIQQYKLDKVQEIKERLTGADVLFADYRGMNVAQVTELRKQLRTKNATFAVVKNNLVRIAFEELKIPNEKNYFIGPTAITIVKSDIGPVTKILVDFAKESPIQFKGGVIAGKTFSGEEIDALSKLPGKEQLIAMLMGTMNAPVRNLMYAMNGIVTKLVRTIQALADKKTGE